MDLSDGMIMADDSDASDACVAMQDRFTGISFHCKALYTDLGEGDLADPLAKVAAANLKVRAWGRIKYLF